MQILLFAALFVAAIASPLPEESEDAESRDAKALLIKKNYIVSPYYRSIYAPIRSVYSPYRPTIISPYYTKAALTYGNGMVSSLIKSLNYQS